MNENIKCPFCGQEIKSYAVKCRHCLSVLKENDNIKKDSTFGNKEIPQGKSAPFSKPLVILCVIVLFVIVMASQNIKTEDKVKQFNEADDVVSSSSGNITTLTVSAYQNDIPDYLPSFNVVGIEDLSIIGAIRYNLDVVISEPVDLEQIKSITEHIITSAKNESSFNAISIMYYDYPEYIGFGYTLGRIDYAPDGEWEHAAKVTTGDYVTMEYNYDVKIKDWSKRLTPEEVAIWREWEDIYDNIGKEDVAYVLVSNEFNVSESEIETIINKQINWTFMNMQ
jgi:hypothetical protein